MDYTDYILEQREKLERLEEEIKENVEWLYTTEDDEVECIGIENLEGILTRFFGTRIDLIQK
tara:strand:- start:162 stop:347 length:186 start_codon:yes stop_codon:yes gene_type:complete